MITDNPKTKSNTTTRTTCRVCGSDQLKDLFSLGPQRVSNFVERKDIESGPICPIDIVLCRNCTLVQQRHTAPQELLYRRFYWYRSGVTETMRRQLKEVADQAVELVKPQPLDVILDIGSNDGTLLRCFHNHYYRIGFEPAENLHEEGANGIDKLVPDFWSAEAYRNALPKANAKIVTALGMFYDLEDPNQFIHDIAKVLHRDGVFISQLMCLQNMLETNDVGNLCHEHLEFYSLQSLEYLFDRNGLEIFDIQHNNVNGGSYRIFAKRKDGTIEQTDEMKRRVSFYFHREIGLDKVDTYANFFRRIEANKKDVSDFILSANKAGKTIFVYGASTKGNTLLQYWGLDNKLIPFASDRSPEKWGKYTVGTGIEIISEEAARALQPDYFLVLPYAFLPEFLEREKRWRAMGGKFIVPLPEMEVV